MGVQIIDNRRVWDLLLKNVKVSKKSYTKVGYQRKDQKKEKESDVLVVDVAIANEFGTNKIPARSFIRTYFEGNKNKLAKLGMALYMDVIIGKKTPKLALGQLGEYTKAGIQKKIDEIIYPPNAPETIAKKKSSKPLIDTGQLRASVTHEEVIF